MSTEAWRQKYETHLASEKWRSLRARVIARAGGLCEGCLVAPGTHVHHVSYVHVGREFAFELLLLCVPCHERWHKKRIGGVVTPADATHEPPEVAPTLDVTLSGVSAVLGALDGGGLSVATPEPASPPPAKSWDEECAEAMAAQETARARFGVRG